MSRLGFSLIIPAAGSGTRMGCEGNKLLLVLAGNPVLWHTLRAFKACRELREVVLAVRPDEAPMIQEVVSASGLGCPVKLVFGGETRQESVYNALTAVDQESQWVWIHDGARPFVTGETMEKLLEAQQRGISAIAAVPVKDTIKQAGPDGVVQRTPQREGLWHIQTPQVFRRAELLEANRKALADHFQGTDDASLIERAGGLVTVIRGDYFNIKITTPEDLVLAEAILAHHKE